MMSKKEMEEKVMTEIIIVALDYNKSIEIAFDGFDDRISDETYNNLILKYDDEIDALYIERLIDKYINKAKKNLGLA